MVNINKILIIDDEKDICDLLEYNLSSQGYLTQTTFNGKEALDLLDDTFDLIISDVMMPIMDGFTLCKKIRASKESYNKIPIIFLTAKDSDHDEISGLDLGANDFIKKPIKIKNLLARIRSQLKSNTTQKDTIINWGDLAINKSNFTIQIDSKSIRLTKSEFKILITLMDNENKIFTRNELLDIINEDNVILNDRIIDVHINSIRKKLSKYRTIIETVVGVGYIANRSTN